MGDKIVNLDNPIFVVYVNVDGLSRQKAEQVLCEVNDTFNVYSNITIWLMPTKTETKIECVYDGKSRNRDIELENFIEKINERIDAFSQLSTFEDFKMLLRDWRLNKLV